MPRIKQETVYQFDELQDKAKEKAREWYRNGALDYEWWDGTFDDAKTCLALAGFRVDKIYFSGFSSQGDGACFEGGWSACDAKPVKAMKQHAPQDKTLHDIAATVRAIAKEYPDAHFSVKHRGHYNHEMCTEFSVDMQYCGRDDKPRTDAEWAAIEKAASAAEEELIEAARDAMRWIYRRLAAEYDWLQSDEQVDESIRANEYEFDEDGRRA